MTDRVLCGFSLRTLRWTFFGSSYSGLGNISTLRRDSGTAQSSQLAACCSAKPDRLLAVEFGEKRGQIRISVTLFRNSFVAGFALGVCRG